MGVETHIYYDLDEFSKYSKLLRFDIFKRINYWRLQKEHRLPRIQSILIGLFNWHLIKVEKLVNNLIADQINIDEPDLVLVVKGKSIYPDTLKKIRDKSRCMLFYYNEDDQGNGYSTSEKMDNCLSIYDRIFTWSLTIRQRLNQEGYSNIEYLPFAYDSTVYDLDNGFVNVEHDYDVVFIGTHDTERESYLSSITDLKLGIWGSHWENVSNSKLKPFIMGKFASIDDMKKIYRSSKICLNIMRPQNEGSHNMKTFEIPALGGFLMTLDTEEHRIIFKNKDVIGTYTSLKDFREKVLSYLNDTEITQKIKTANAIVINNNTYLQRANDIIKIFTSMKPNY